MSVSGRSWKWILAGVLAGVLAGGLAYSRASRVVVTQPIRFSHSVHARQDVACPACHFTGPDRAFSGLPPIEVCARCHSEPSGGLSEDGKEMDKLVTQYVKRGREVPWLVLAREPDHVIFVHGPHLKRGGGRQEGTEVGANGGRDCVACHPDMSGQDYPELRRNLISGYSNWTMSMSRCRSCHDKAKAPGDCVACHR